MSPTIHKPGRQARSLSTLGRMVLSPKFRVAIVALLYGCAGLQLVRFYVKTSDFYLKMPAYMAGHERLPFQERVLPIFLFRPMFHSTFLMGLLVHRQGVSPWSKGPFYLLSLVSLLIAAVLTQLLYKRVSRHHTLSLIVCPLFLFCVTWTYVIHNEANFSYPYDLPSLAFFTGGLYSIYQRRFLPLLLIMLVGPFNRETTLFLIGIYLLDAARRASDAEPGPETGAHGQLGTTARAFRKAPAVGPRGPAVLRLGRRQGRARLLLPAQRQL